MEIDLIILIDEDGSIEHHLIRLNYPPLVEGSSEDILYFQAHYRLSLGYPWYIPDLHSRQDSLCKVLRLMNYDHIALAEG